ncbi:MAG TPA: hypothetical protein VG737_12775 [Cyclobacteriaceae bacterium]|nr:hypothetical protein [Cyclobacteriaceae bacterium]
MATPVTALPKHLVFTRHMINPYFSYVVAFVLALIAYSFGWSELFPALTGPLLVFIGSTILFHIAFSLYWKKNIRVFRETNAGLLHPVWTTLFIYFLWTLDFVNEGGIPLFKILLGQPYDYKLFGVPSLHVFTVTFASFFTVHLFSLFISSRERIYFVLYIINLSAALLIYSRAMLIFNVVASAFVFFLAGYAFSWKRLSVLSLGCILLIYVFGVLGTFRVSAEVKRNYDPQIFMDIGGATEGFRNSFFPPEFFWAYVYFSSPLANLQQNINTFNVPPFSVARLGGFVNNEMLLDFISKRINHVAGVVRERENVIPKKPFNVSTVYSRSYSYLGWAGIILIAVFVLLFPLAYMKSLPSNSYTVAGVAILNTMYVFLFYDNTLRFTGLGLQLAYPFVLPMVEKAINILKVKMA